jgi:hypothetical protein
MTKHKWHKEIKAWADGAEIEWLCGDDWKLCDEENPPQWLLNIEYRIKPQPKEPQYLYVYRGSPGGIIFTEELAMGWDGRKLLGKIKLEQDDE